MNVRVLLLQLGNDERQCAQNQEVVNILTSQERVGVFDVKESFHDCRFKGYFLDLADSPRPSERCSPTLPTA